MVGVLVEGAEGERRCGGRTLCATSTVALQVLSNKACHDLIMFARKVREKLSGGIGMLADLYFSCVFCHSESTIRSVCLNLAIEEKYSAAILSK